MVNITSINRIAGNHGVGRVARIGGAGVRRLLAAALLVVSTAAAAHAQAPKEQDYYRIIPIPIPQDIVLECGGLEIMPDGRLAVGTRRGDVYFVAGAYDDPPANVTFTRWATGLHEILGLSYKDGCLYATTRGELTKLKDTDGDDLADVYDNFCDDWGITGDYHEYAFGSKWDKNGYLWMVHCLTGSFTSNIAFRGWCLRVDKNGKLIPTASGIRSPGGIGFNHLGEVFYTDNQGPWNGTSSLKQLLPGSFQGHPIGNKWYKDAPNMGPPPKTPTSNSRIYIEAEKIPQFIPPPILLPHVKVGQASSGIACDVSDGKFGPFVHQMFVGDQHHSNIARCFLEKIDGRYQGACFIFKAGFASGVVPMIQAPDGSLFVGGTNRGWGSVGPKPFSLERLVWTGKTPFEVHEMRIKPDGFELTFTQPVDKATADDLKSYQMTTYTYLYRAEYGSPEVDHTTPMIKSVTVGEDGRSVRLVVDGLQIGHIHELHMPGVRSSDQKPLLHDVGYYTLWHIPDK